MSHKIFVTSQPRLGKSTVIKKVVDVLGRENCYGFYTEEIMVAGKREGFKIITTGHIPYRTHHLTRS